MGVDERAGAVAYRGVMGSWDGGEAVLNWSNYVALGDSLTAGRDDHGPGGVRIGWARRLAGILTARTAVPCALTNLAVDGASVAVVLEQQLPSVARIGPNAPIWSASRWG